MQLSMRTLITRSKQLLGECQKTDVKYFFPIDSSVQIAHKHRWTGTFRVVAHLNSNLILEKAGQLFKWPKYKTRLLEESPEEACDEALFPKKPGKKSRAEKPEVALSLLEKLSDTTTTR